MSQAPIATNEIMAIPGKKKLLVIPGATDSSQIIEPEKWDLFDLEKQQPLKENYARWVTFFQSLFYALDTNSQGFFTIVPAN